MSTATTLITAEEYAQLPDLGRPTELVQGEIIEMNLPGPRHGQVSAKAVYFGLQYNEKYDCMHVLSNDTGVVTERDPDTVRGPDVWYVTYAKVPKGPLPATYLDVVPDVVFEVVSPSDGWDQILKKVSEYLAAGVPVVCVLDPESASIQLFYRDKLSQTLTVADELTFPGLLPGFAVEVFRFFE
jgi:Uma2 family endonuclease